MAIFHLSVKLLTRSKGRSAIAAAAYRHALRIRDERTGTIHDYRRKSGVVHSEILAQTGTPNWAIDRTKLWNAMECFEKRRDAQLSREIEVALPAELTDAERLDLVRGWVAAQLTTHGMIADLAIHEPGNVGDRRNHHAHIMTTLRPIISGKIGPKIRNWGNRPMVLQWRQSWAEHCNRHLELAGSEARVDHRSLRVQGIDRKPTVKMGPAAAALDRKAGRPVSVRGGINAAVIAQNRLKRQQRVLAVRSARRAARELSHFVKDSLTMLTEIEPDTPPPRSITDLVL